jgi:hypothetical protein
MNRSPFMALNLLMIFSPSACTAASTSPPDVSQHPLSREAASSSKNVWAGRPGSGARAVGSNPFWMAEARKASARVE